MPTNTEIANKSIGHLGTLKDIGNLDTEDSPEARAVRRYYDDAVNKLQREFPYGFATIQRDLALVKEDPNVEWRFEYQYPSDCQLAGRILTGLYNDSNQSRAPYKVVYGDSGRVIWTNCQDATLEFQIIVQDTARFQCDFVLALSYKLAEIIAPSLTKGDAFGLGLRAKDSYREEVSLARGNSLNEQQEKQPPQAESIRARAGLEDYTSRDDWGPFPINYTVS